MLVADLSTSFCYSESPLQELYRCWLGGLGLSGAICAGDLLKRSQVEAGVASIATGPLTGTPLLGAGAWVATCVPSVPGRGLSVAYGTGHLGAVLKFAGWDQLVLEGAAPRPSLLVVDQHGCRLEELRLPETGGPVALVQEIKERLGRDAAVLAFSHVGMVADRGLVFGGLDISSFLARRNLFAMAVRGSGSIRLANPGGVLDVGLEASRRWRVAGLPGGNSGCLSCHGRCSVEQTAALSAMEPAAVAIWLSAGICPRLIVSGNGPWTLSELERLLYNVTGCQFRLDELWQMAQQVKKVGGVLKW